LIPTSIPTSAPTSPGIEPSTGRTGRTTP
jgi:hypothetical protein